MTDRDLTRRRFVEQSMLAVGPVALAATTMPMSSALAEDSAERSRVICVGAHPDDPESGCGGTLARYAAAGHTVKIVYLPRGERGIADKSLDDAAHIRTAEAN